MKRIISFVLCLSMLVSMLPVSAFAADVEEITPVTEAAVETEAIVTEAPVEDTTAAAEPEDTEAPETEAPETTGSTTAPGETIPEVTEPAGTESAETEETEPEEIWTEFDWTPDVELPSEEELFAGYVDKVLYGTSTFGIMAGSRLTGDTKLAYDGFVELIGQVAAGELDSAALTVRADYTGTSFTGEMLDELFTALLADLPYELYWFDKTSGVGGGYSVDGNKILASVTLRFCVSPDYSATGAEGTYDLDTAKTGAAAAAAANARDIVDAYADSSDYEKLVAYRDEICALTSYNDQAASSGYTGGYGDPWQLIWVFDGDVSTKVVCEGYSKAFQYLCDLSDFDNDIVCYNVQGTMGGGGHMWNIVTINGSSYMVDVTNSEVGTIGYKDKLFLVGGTANSDGSYTFASKKFAYDADAIALWGSGEDSILTLATSNFDPDTLNVPMTGEELQAALDAASGQYWLEKDVVITSDVVIPQNTYMNASGDVNITVKDGGSLTISDRAALGVANGAGLTVEQGAGMIVNGDFAVGGGTVCTVAGTLENNGKIDVNYGTLDITGTYTAGETASVKKDTVGTINGIDTGSIILYSYVYDEATLAEALVPAEGYASTHVYLMCPDSDYDGTVDGPIVFTQDVTVPEGVELYLGYFVQNDLFTLGDGVTLTVNGDLLIMSSATLGINWGGTVVNNGYTCNFGTIRSDGCFVQNGQLQQSGTVMGCEPVEAMAAEDLLAALESCGGQYVLTEAVVISENMTIPEVRIEIEGGALIVNEGVTLTNNGGIVVRNGGTVTVNGTLENTGWYLDVEDGGLMTVSGALTGNDVGVYGGRLNVYGTLDISQVHVNVLNLTNTFLVGVPQEKTHYVANPTTTDELIAALAMVEQYNPWIGMPETLTLDKDVTVPAGANVAFENATLTVGSGTTLTLDGEFYVHPNCHLIVEEGGTLVNNVNLTITNHSSHENGAVVTVDGELVSNGGIWISDGGELNVNGTAVVYRELHAGFGGNGLLCPVNVSGELTVYAYTNIVPGTGELNIAEGGAVTVGGNLCDEEGNPWTNGFLQAGGNVNVYGTLNLDGGFTLGCEDGTSELNVYEGGTVNVPQDNMWCDITETGLVSNEGTVTNDGIINVHGTISNYAQFINNGQVRLFGTGTYDDYNDTSIGGNEPVDGAQALLDAFLNDLEDGQGANLYDTVTLAEDLTIDLGEDQVVLHGGSELHIPNGVTLTVNSLVIVQEAALVVEEGGTLIVNTNLPVTSEGALGCIIVNGHMVINDGGTLWLDNGGTLEICGSGVVDVIDDPATQDVGAAIHVAYFSDGATVMVEGTLNTGGYINVTPGGWLILQESGTLNIRNDAEYGCGYLDVSGMAQLWGTVNQDGLMSVSNGNGTDEFVAGTARIEINGELNGSDTSSLFINPNASIGVCDTHDEDGNWLGSGTLTTAGEVILEAGGTLWVDGETTLSGPVTNYGNIHINCFGDSASGNDAALNLNGTVTNYGYLCVHPEGSVYVNGTLTIGQTEVEGQGFAGYLNSFGYVTVNDGGVINNYALMDTDSPDGSGYLYINAGGTVNVKDNIIMAVCDGGELVIDGTLNVFTDAYMEVYNAVSGSGSWINNGTVHFGVFTDPETGSESVGYSYFDGWFTQGDDGGLEVELYQGEPIYVDLLPTQMQDLVYFGSDLESIRTVFGNAEYIARVHIREDAVTLNGDLVVGTNGVLVVDDELTIPENVTLTAYGSIEVNGQLNVEGTLKLYHPRGTLTVNENGTVSVTGTVFNGTSTTVHGDLIIDGSWEGYAPVSTETGTITSSGAQEQLNALLENEEATLTFDVTLTENTVVSGYLAIAEGVTLTVPRGITLTIDGIVDVYGTLTVKSGASVVNNGILCAYSTGKVACASTTCYSGDGSVQAIYEKETLCSITNIPRSVQTLCAVDIDSESGLQSAMDMVGNGGYLGGMLFPVADITLTEDLTVLGNVTVVINGPTDAEGNYDGDYVPVSLTVPEDVFVSVEGGIEVGCEATLTLNGSMAVYGYVYVAEDGCMNLNGWCDNYNALVVFGTLNQNGAMGNTGGRVRIMEGSALNMSEDAYAWNFMAYGEDGGYFGTYENYPADKLYLHTYPQSAADIRTLVTEYQTGSYADGTAQIDPCSGYGSEFVIDEDVTLVEGIGIMVIDTEGLGAATLTIAEGVNVAIENGALIRICDGCSLVNNGILNISGGLVVHSGAAMTSNHYVFIKDGGELTVETEGTLVKNSEIAVEVGGTLINEGVFTDNTTDYHLGLFVRYINGEYGTVTGIPTSQQILHFPEDMDEDAMRTFLDFVRQGGYRMGISHINENLTLTEDLTIDGNVTLVINSLRDSEGNVPEVKTFTVPEGVTVRNNGTFQVAPDSRLVVNGTWLGNVPENYGTIEGNIPMSQDELVAMIEAAGPGGYIELTRNVTIAEDLTVDNVYLDVAEGATMYVPAGVTLTWNATDAEYYSVLGVWGNLIVDGRLVNNAELACEYSGTITIAEDGYSGDGIVSNAYLNEGQKGTIIGIPEAQQTLVIVMATSEEAIRDAIAKADIFGSVIILARQDVTINEDLEIPENVTLRLYREIVDGEVIPATMTVSENAFVTVYGTLIVFEHGTLTVDGILIVPGELIVLEGGLLVNNLEVACDYSGTITIADGCYTEGENGAMVMGFEYGRHGVIEGVPQNEQILVGACTSQSETQQVMDMAGDYRSVLVHLDEDMTIDSDLTIPENVTIWIQSREGEDGAIGKTTIHVTENATVTNNGRFEVREDTCLIVDGRWEGNAPEVFGEIGGDFYVIDQEEFEELLASGDTWISVQGIVELTEQTVIPEGITVELLGTSCMTVPAGVTLIVEGGLILMHDSVLNVEGILDNRCYVSVRDWAVLDAESGEYFQAEGAVLENVHWGDTEGNVTHATILGIPVSYQYMIVNGGDEALIRELLSHATTYGAPYLEINIYDEVILSSSLYLPEIVNMTIENWEGGTAHLIVPKGVTLYNDGRIAIRENGILTVNGKFMGNLPEIDHPTAQFIINGEIDFDQNDLEAMLAEAAENGTGARLCIPLTLTKDLVIPEGAYLHITGSGSITVPAGRTLTNNGWIDVELGGSLTAVSGGTVKNNGGIGIMSNASVDLTGGVYEHGEGARIELHYGNEGPGTAVGAELVGIPYEYVTITQAGWDETQLRNIINLANNLYPIAGMEIRIIGEMTLTENLTIPEFATVLIQSAGYGPAVLRVPNGVTLTNNGLIQIGYDGSLIVERLGTLEGNQPIVFVGSGEYVNNNFTEADLRAYIDRQANGKGEVYLSSNITLTEDLVIPENVILVISKGGALRVPAGVKLTINGKIKTQMDTGLFIQGGTVENNGIIENMHWGITELISGTYTGDGKLYEVYNSNELGFLYNPDTGEFETQEDAAFVRGFAIEDRTIVARGCDEDNIHMVLDLAQAVSENGISPWVELWVTDGELYLTRDLTVPYRAELIVGNQRMFGGSLIVPEGVTLYNNGHIHIHNDGYMEVQSGAVLDNAAATDIGWAGTLIIREGGIIAGNHPFCYDTGATYINENTYGQAYLEALIQGAQSAGGGVTLSVPVTLTSDLVIPEGVTLYITGRDNFITIPEGVTLYNYGSIYCHMFGGILGQGGWLRNNGEIRAMNWGAVDMGGSWGNFSRATDTDIDTRIHNHHWIYTDGTEGRGTVVGFQPGDVIVHTEGDDSRVLNEMVDFIWHVGDNENGIWSELDSLVTGDMILSRYLDWPIFGTLVIPEDASLTVPAGETLDIHGTVIVRGRLIIEEGAVVNTYYPICVDGGEISGNDDSVRYYNPGVALEGFTVSVSTEEAAPGQSVTVLADSWTPANAEVLAFEYTVLGDNGLFGYDLDGSPMRWIFSDPGAPVRLTAEHGGEVTVEVRAIIGVDENGLIYNEQVETVSVTFTGLTIGIVTKDAPDYFENGIPGLWAGGKTIVTPTLFDTLSGEELPADLVTVTWNQEAEQFAKIVNKANVITITALSTMTQRETIELTFTAEGAAPETYVLNLRPKATAANVMLYGESVTNQTILADLNRGDWGFQLEAAGIAPESVPENGTDANGNALVTWKSSAPAIATVDENGWVSFTGEKLGKVKITVTANYGAKKTAIVTFNVAQLPQEIFASETNPTVLVGGGSGAYTVTDYEGNVLKATQVKWYLSDEYGEAIASHPYATLTAAGKLTTKAVADETKIYLMAQVIGDEWSAKLYAPVCVTVYPAIESVQILDAVKDPINDKTLLYDNSIHGLTYQLSWKAAPYMESVQSVSWKSSKPAVADIDGNGLITVASEDASGAVKFTLTVTALNGKKSTAAFTMKFGIFTTALDLAVTMPDGTVTDDLSDLYVIGGETLTFAGSCVPENVTTNGVVWSVADKTYGAISAKGVLKTKAVNNPTEFIVIAESKDGYVGYEIAITLLPKQVSTPDGMMDALLIWNDDTYLTKATHTMLAGDGMWLYANADVTWKSSNTNVATVDEGGYLTARNNGSATITATATDGSKRTATFTLKVSKLSEFVEITTKKGEPFTVASGKSLDLVGTVTYSDGSTDKKVDWSVDDTSIATISTSGKLAAAKGLTKAATVRVYADAKDGNSYSWEDILVVPMTSAIEVFGPFGAGGRNMDVSNTTVTWDMLYSDSFTLNAVSYPYDAMQDVTWKSSSAKIAEIDEQGNVTCNGSGTVTITATAKDGSGKKATFKLTVMKTMAYLELPETASVGGGKTLTFSKLEGYSVDPDATNKTLTWSMTYPDGSPVPTTVATLTKGVLKTKTVTAPVTIFIRAEATDGSGLADDCTVTICPVVTAVSIVNAPAKLAVGRTVDLDAICSPDGSMQDVTWKTSSASMATVDANGVVTALKTGTVTITATAADGSGKKATAKIQLIEAPAVSTEISLWTYPIGNWGDEATVSSLVSAFEAETGIRVNVEYLTYADGDIQIDTAIEAGVAPDLVLEGPERITANWGANGHMVNIADLFDSTDKQQIFSGLLDSCFVNETTAYQYPLAITAHCMAINKTVFEAAGAMQYIDEETHTWTTENFLSAVQAVYEYTGTRVGAVYCGGQGGDQGTRALVNNLYGGTYTNADHTAYTWDSGENIAALKALVDCEGIEFDSNLSGGQEIAKFRSGELQMSFCWNIAQHTGSDGVTADGDEILFMAFPSPEGTDSQLQGGIWGFGIFDNGDAARIEAAKEFIRYFCDSDATADAVAAAGYFPARSNVGDGWTTDPIMEEYNSLMPLLGDYYQVADNWAEARAAWWEMLQAVGASDGSTEAITAVVQTYLAQANGQ